ncbi:MAG TPA: glycosyltransferase family 4 protein [Negativicutes bacterium]|nr:glycosyltransferase family 4 protein [Negativicutes bacterium]
MMKLKILSIGFPTNMPDSEMVSQGGPANFARLFSHYIAGETEHSWIGLMFDAGNFQSMRLVKKFSFPQREYYKLYLPKKKFNGKITHAKKGTKPEIVFDSVIGRVVAFIREKKPDVVFLNGFGMFNWILLKAAEKTKTPVVIQHAGIWTKELRLHSHLYSLVGRRIMEGMEQEATRLAAAEVFLNSWSRDYYANHVAKPKEAASSIIPLPFDFGSFDATAKTASDMAGAKDAFRIGIIARWDTIKNHRAFLALAKESKRQGLAFEFSAVTKIPVSDTLAKDYTKNITTIAGLNRAGVNDFCRSMDLLVLPSLFDVSPTVVLEAIATKTPVAISGNIGYINDFIRGGAKGWIIDFSNVKKSLSTIKKLAGKPMPKDFQDQMRNKHGHKKVFSAYLELFLKVARNHKPMAPGKTLVLPAARVLIKVV